MVKEGAGIRVPDSATSKNDVLHAARVPATALSINRVQAGRARLLFGTAAIAAAVTIPDVSFGAIGTAVMRVDLVEPELELPGTIWNAAAPVPGSVYAPVIAAEAVAPSAVTFSSLSNYGEFEHELPVGILEAGSQRFDLAFAGIPTPALDSILISGREALSPVDVAFSAPEFTARPGEPAQFAHLVQVSQIAVQSADRGAPGLGAGRVPEAQDAAQDGTQVSADASIEAAFAGAIDVSGEVRNSLPISASEHEDVARALPISAPDIGMSASADAQSAFTGKTSLDARVNGVLTGSVDFQQRDGTIAIRLGSVVDLLSQRFTSSELERMQAGQSINTFVTLEQLQSAGIPINYNPAYDEVEFGIDYDDAPSAAKVQVEQIGAPTIGSDRALIDQIPR